MSKKLVLTEKPSVAKDFAKVLGASPRGKDYFENENNSREFLNYTITNCEAQAQMITRDQKQLIEVTIKGDAQWEKNYVYYDGDKERETETEDAEHTLYYIDDGGTWKLYDLDLWTW